MKNIIKLSLLILVVSSGFLTSCKKDYLNELPPTSLTPATALANETDVATALFGAYSGLRAVDNLGRTLPVLGDLMSDNTYQSPTNSNRYSNFNNYLYVVADGNVSGIWNNNYNTILRCNNIINSTLPASVNMNQYRGEAFAVRALCYFNLVRYFATPFTDNPNALGVPIVTRFDITLLPARSKVSDVYGQINGDLNQAYTLMMLYRNSTQFSKFAAKGLQAKVYLTMGDKINAKIAALDVITNGGFTVVPAASHAAFWSTALPRTDKVETLFEVSSDVVSNNGFDGLANIYSQAGYGDMLCSDDFYNSFNALDVRKALYAPGTRGGLSVFFINKFPGTNGSDVSDTKVIRLSEVYLIAAEASLPGNEPDALLYSNFITSKRGIAPIASTGTVLFDDIINERRKELAFEGDRFMDLQRLQRKVIRSTNYPLAARTIDYNNPLLATNSYKRTLPIPQSELDANSNIRGQQNFGW